jgi:hypothetical protein
MPAKWQLWMPFHIDRFRGSPDVQAMHPVARIGYIYLMGRAWQSEDCSLSADPIDLATDSGLGDELWTVYGPRILRKFKVRDDGRLINKVLSSEWAEAKRVYEARLGAANRTNNERSPQRSPHDKATVTARSPQRSLSRSADTRTGTETVTEPSSKSKDTAPSKLAAAAPPLPAPVIFLPLNDRSLYPVTPREIAEWSDTYQAVDVLDELRKMRGWCDGNPRQLKTKSGIKAFIHRWLAKEQNRARANPHGRSHANGNRAQQRTEGNFEALRRSMASEGEAVPDGFSGDEADVGERADFEPVLP